MWKSINQLFKDVSSITQLNEISYNGAPLRWHDLASAFNDFFVNLVDSAFDEGAMEFLKPTTGSSMFINPTSEMMSTFTWITNNKSCDADSFQIKPIKYSWDILCPVLAHIFNISLSSGVFPSEMQKAKETVIFKGGDKHNLTNYRPRAITPIFSRSLEKII